MAKYTVSELLWAMIVRSFVRFYLIPHHKGVRSNREKRVRVQSRWAIEIPEKTNDRVKTTVRLADPAYVVLVRLTCDVVGHNI